MAQRRTLLADLVPRLGDSSENLATEALRFVLANSHPVRVAFSAYMSALVGATEPEVRLSWTTQAADVDGTIPDLVGTDESGCQRVFVEVKFWAGLTEAQPIAYLARLQRTGGAGLVFLAPANRLVALWAEILVRCREAGIAISEAANRDSGTRTLRVSGGPSLAATSWDTVLATLGQAAATSQDIAAAEDLRQLAGVCARMEEAGFLPLTSSELTGGWVRRIEDFCGLVDDVTAHLVAKGHADVRGLRAAAGRDSYGRYLYFKGHPAQLAFLSGRWRQLGRSPIWLRLYGPGFSAPTTVLNDVRPLMQVEPPRGMVADDGALLVPLRLLANAERDRVLEDLLGQMAEIYSLLSTGQKSTGGPEPPDSGAEPDTSGPTPSPDAIG